MSRQTPATQRNHTSPTRNGDVQHWKDKLELNAVANDEFNPEDIIARMLTAESFEEALAAQDSSLESGKNLVGVPHRVDDFQIRKSDSKYADNEATLGYYAVVKGVRLDTGEPLTYSVGASNVVAILWQAQKFGHIPGTFVLDSKTSQSGYDVLFLKPYKSAKGAPVPSAVTE